MRYLLFLMLSLSSAVFAAPASTTLTANSQHAMVVTSQHLATDVGVSILKAGGNAVDAAVAVGYALAVVDPCCGNIGGGGFMLVQLANGKTAFLNFRERAPLAIQQSDYSNGKGGVDPKKTKRGYLAVGVPGTVMGLNEALKKYGTLSLKQVMAPAIQLANKGYQLNAHDVALLKIGAKTFAQQPNVAAIFLKHSKPYTVGERLVQKDLAATLKIIQQGGTKAFYEGPIAKALVKASDAQGGRLSLDDFKQYTVQWLTPISCQYRGYQIISAPPPSSGGVTLCEMLGILQHYPLNTLGFHTAKSAHYMIEAMRYAYADRNEYLGDPDFVNNPIDKLLSPQHIKNIVAQIKPDKAGDSSRIGFTAKQTGEKMQTTHYSIIDGAGNAVAVTYTINGYFGAYRMAGKTGFFLNNEMDDFTLTPSTPNLFGLIQSDKNAIKPGKRPLSSMTPTIVTKAGNVKIVVGSAGGSTIITQVLQAIIHVLDYHLSIAKAVNVPRFHMQWMPDSVFIEPEVFSQTVRAELSQMGYSFALGSPFGGLRWGRVAMIGESKHGLAGAMDKRAASGSAKGF